MTETICLNISRMLEGISHQRHVVILREASQKLLLFWACMGVTLLAAKYATSFPLTTLSTIAILLMMASYVYVIASRLARHYGASGTASGLSAVFVCFLCSYQTFTDNPTQDFAIWFLLALSLGECFGFLSRFQFENRIMPAKAEDYLSDLFPCIGTMMAGLFIAFLSPLFFPLIRSIFLWIAHLMDSLVFVIAIVLVISIGKLFSPDLPKIARAFVRPFWIFMSLANLYAFFHKGAYPFITTESFFHWYVWIGGAGASLGLALDLFVLSPKDQKKQCLTYMQEGFFNLNDSLYQEVIVKDRRMWTVPFVLAPVLSAAGSYLAIANGMITPSRLPAPWMLPGALGSFLATGLDERAIGAALICLAVSMAVYLPFAVVHVRKQKS
ncbi:MAG: hypothetical protein ACI32N_01720 [Bulleidia sp.]